MSPRGRVADAAIVPSPTTDHLPRAGLSTARSKRRPLSEWLVQIGGALYALLSLGCMFAYSDVLERYAKNDYLWTHFNASGAQTFVADVFNAKLWNVTGSVMTLALFDTAADKSYDSSKTVISITPTDARRIAIEHLNDLTNAIRSLRAQDNAVSVHVYRSYCWLDFAKQFEVAHTARRQARCLARAADNGVVYMETMLRNIEWTSWARTWGTNFDIAYGSALKESAGGMAWLNATTAVYGTLTVEQERSFWAHYGVRRFDHAWYNGRTSGFYESIKIETVLQVFTVPIKAIPLTSLSAWKSVYANFGLFNDWTFASTHNVSLVRSASNFFGRSAYTPELFYGVYPLSVESVLFHDHLGPLGSVDLNFVFPPHPLVLLYDTLTLFLLDQVEADDAIHHLYRQVPASIYLDVVPNSWRNSTIQSFRGGNPLCLQNQPQDFVQQLFSFDDDCSNPQKPLGTDVTSKHLVLATLLSTGTMAYAPSELCVQATLENALTCQLGVDAARDIVSGWIDAGAVRAILDHSRKATSALQTELPEIMQYVTLHDATSTVLRHPLLDVNDPVWSFAGWVALLDWVQGTREVIAFEGDVTTMVLMSSRYLATEVAADPRQIPTRFSQLVYGVAWYVNGIVLVVCGMVLLRCLVASRGVASFRGRNAFFYQTVVGVVWIGRPLVFVRGLLALAILSTAPLSLQTHHGLTRLAVVPRTTWETLLLASESIWVTHSVHDVLSLWTTSRTMECMTLSSVLVWSISVAVESLWPVRPSATMARQCTSRGMGIVMECDAGTVVIASTQRFLLLSGVHFCCILAASAGAYWMNRVRRPVGGTLQDIPVVIPAMAYYLMAPTTTNPDLYFDPVTSIVAGLVPFRYFSRDYIFNALLWLNIPLRESVNTAFAFRQPTHVVRPSLKSKTTSLTSSSTTSFRRAHRTIAFRALVGGCYLVCSAATSALFFYVSEDKLSNGFLWQGFNSSGMHAFLTQLYNNELRLRPSDDVVIDVEDPAFRTTKLFNTSTVTVEFSPVYAQRMQFEEVSVQSVVEGLRRMDACLTPWIATQYCYVDFGRQWEMANTEKRQERCRRHMTDNGAVFLESVFRNVQWSQLDECWGEAIQIGVEAELQLSARGREWLSSTKSAATTPPAEVEFWGTFNVTKYVVQWQNYKRLGIHEVFAVENAFGLTNTLSTKMSGGTFYNTMKTSQRMYWGWASDLWLAQHHNASSTGGLSLIRSSADFAFQNASMEEILVLYREIASPLDNGLASTRAMLGPFGSVDLVHVPCPSDLITLWDHLSKNLSRAVYADANNVDLQFKGSGGYYVPTAWSNLVKRGGNPLCPVGEGYSNAGLLQFFGQNVACGSVLGETTSLTTYGATAALVASQLYLNPVADKAAIAGYCDSNAKQPDQCKLAADSMYDWIVATVPHPVLAALADEIQAVRIIIATLSIEVVQYVGPPVQLLRMNILDPTDPGYAFFAWHLVADWVAGRREVIMFEGDEGTMTLMSTYTGMDSFQPNPLEVPTHFAYYCRLCIQYTTLVLFLVSFCTGLHGLASRGHIEGLNMLEVNRVAGIVWVGRPLLLLRSIAAMCLLATSSLTLVQLPSGITQLVSHDTSNVLSVILAGTETYWFVIVWSDLFMLVTRDLTTKYSAYSGCLIWLVTVVLSFASPVEPLVVVRRSCMVEHVDYQVSCSAGYVRIGHVRRLVLLSAVSLVIVLLCFVWERWQHKSFRLPHHTTSLLLPAGAFYLYNKGPWIFDDILYLDSASAFMCGLLSVRRQDRIYLLDIKTWRTFVFVIDDEFDPTVLSDNVYDQRRIASAIPMIE